MGKVEQPRLKAGLRRRDPAALRRLQFRSTSFARTSNTSACFRKYARNTSRKSSLQQCLIAFASRPPPTSPLTPTGSLLSPSSSPSLASLFGIDVDVRPRTEPKFAFTEVFPTKLIGLRRESRARGVQRIYQSPDCCSPRQQHAEAALSCRSIFFLVWRTETVSKMPHDVSETPP